MSEASPPFEAGPVFTLPSGLGEAVYRDESGTAVPPQLSLVDDRLTADAALKRVRRAEHLLYSGDFRNARQLLTAMGRRLGPPPGKPPKSALEAFRTQRLTRAQEHATLGRVLVRLDDQYRLCLAQVPAVHDACREVWGKPPRGLSTVVALRTLEGMRGAQEWRRQGLRVPGLSRPLLTAFGIFVPTRAEYLLLLEDLPSVRGKRVFDVGTGTGVLALLYLARGAAQVVATDVEPRAVRCARENAESFGVGKQLEVLQADLFPPGRADIVVCNPPWLPEPPKNRVDRAVFDEGGGMLARFLHELPAHLNAGGEGHLILSDFAELLGLRAPGALAAAFADAGLEVVGTAERPAQHAKAKEKSDPLHPLRVRERTTLYRLRPQGPAPR